MTAVTSQQRPRLLRCTRGGHFGSGLLLASISSWGTAEFVSQERYVLSSTAARLGVGWGLQTPEPAHRELTYAGHRGHEGSVGLPPVSKVSGEGALYGGGD